MISYQSLLLSTIVLNDIVTCTYIFLYCWGFLYYTYLILYVHIYCMIIISVFLLFQTSMYAGCWTVKTDNGSTR